MTTTTASTIQAFVPSERAEARVELAEVPAPVPAANEALVAVGAYSINRGETFLLERPREGWRPGQDVAGRVLEAAADGSGPQAGARVVGHAWQGGWAPRVPVATDALVELPDDVPTTVAATLPLAGLTAIRMLRAAGSLAGRRVLLTGASGGVGHLVVELAAAQGARTTAVTRTPERAERLLALGAADVVHDVDDAEGPFDVVFESVGGASLTGAIARLAPRGTVFWFGAASRETSPLDFFALPQRAKLRRFSYWPHDEPDRVDLQALVDLVAAGRLHPEVGHLADWRETPSALLALRDRRVRGNAVLTLTG
jgi:NADPH:quinone reductase-like Zn-dependent oxidoreductase